MPEAINQGVRIHYQVIGTGEPLVLQHGFYSSIQDWHEYGYIDELQDSFSLILVDARGHGESDKPDLPAKYDLKLHTLDIVAVLDNLAITRAHYWGYSMGGWIGYGMALYAYSRVEKLVIGGAQPYGKDFAIARKTLANGMEAWINEIKNWGPYSLQDLDRYKRNSARALLACANDRSDISSVQDKITRPALFYAGEKDEEHDIIKSFAGKIRDGRFISIPGTNHIETFLDGKTIARHLMGFLIAK